VLVLKTPTQWCLARTRMFLMAHGVFKRHNDMRNEHQDFLCPRRQPLTTSPWQGLRSNITCRDVRTQGGVAEGVDLKPELPATWAHNLPCIDARVYIHGEKWPRSRDRCCVAMTILPELRCKVLYMASCFYKRTRRGFHGALSMFLTSCTMGRDPIHLCTSSCMPRHTCNAHNGRHMQNWCVCVCTCALFSIRVGAGVTSRLTTQELERWFSPWDLCVYNSTQDSTTLTRRECDGRFANLREYVYFL
jgi:hypothetical protein